MNKIGKRFVTQQMIAAESGFHHSTVSLALRNDPRLPAGTRKRIQAVAKRLGYRPNPLLTLLMSRVQRGDVSYRGTLAYVHTVPRTSPTLQGQVHRNYLAGARRRAAELGYKLDEFFLAPGELSGPRLQRLLAARGIMGIVIEHVPGDACPDRRLPLDLDSLAAASIGVPLAYPMLHYVASDQYMRPVLALRELFALGYRRPGLAVFAGFDSNMAHRCSAGFWAVQHYTAGVGHLPICHVKSPADRDVLASWLEEHRPDVMLATTHRLIEMARQLGWRIPEQLGAVCLDWLPQQAPVTGVYGNSEYVAMAAVEQVVSQLHRGEAGPPTRATHYLISNSWVPGETVRRAGEPLDLDAAFFADLIKG